MRQAAETIAPEVFVTNSSDPVNLSDQDIADRVLAGETALFELLVTRHHRRLYRILYTILRDRADVEDALQEAYVRAYSYLRQFSGRAKFANWLTQIAVNEAFGKLRRRNSNSAHLSVSLDVDGAAEVESTSRDPEQLASNRELRLLLASIIAALPEKYRVVFVMRFVEQRSVAETAQHLALTVSNVKVRLHRARALARRKLCERFGSHRVKAAVNIQT